MPGVSKFKKKDNQPDYVVLCEAYLYPFVHRAYKRRPIISDIVDLWPLSIVEYTSVSDSNPLVRFLYWLEKHDYMKSDAIIFSIEGGKEYIQEQKYASKVNEDKVFHINMGCDLEAFDDYFENEKVKEPEIFTVTY